MTVRDLTEKLKQFDQDELIRITKEDKYGGFNYYEIIDFTFEGNCPRHLLIEIRKPK